MVFVIARILEHVLLNQYASDDDESDDDFDYCADVYLHIANS